MDRQDIGDTAGQQQEYADAMAVVLEPPAVQQMTDRDLLLEIATNLRVIISVLESLGQNPMARSMMRASGIKVD